MSYHPSLRPGCRFPSQMVHRWQCGATARHSRLPSAGISGPFWNRCKRGCRILYRIWICVRKQTGRQLLRPRSDRDWIENVDLSVDYYVYTIQAVKNALEMNPMDYKKLKGEESGKKKRKWFCPFRRDK